MARGSFGLLTAASTKDSSSTTKFQATGNIIGTTEKSIPARG
jgi:hypothetical protein